MSKRPRHLTLATLLDLMARARRNAVRQATPGTFRMLPYSTRYGHRLAHIARQMRQGAYRP